MNIIGLLTKIINRVKANSNVKYKFILNKKKVKEYIQAEYILPSLIKGELL